MTAYRTLRPPFDMTLAGTFAGNVTTVDGNFAQCFLGQIDWDIMGLEIRVQSAAGEVGVYAAYWEIFLGLS